jgi:CelD/BcsL family acetyltransferase involved in cellulose biosynthesis
MAGDLEIEVFTRMDGLGPAWEEWRALAVAAGSLFVTPEWAASWFEVYGDTFEPSIRCVTSVGRLVAVMPMMTDSGGSVRVVGDGAGDVFAPLIAADAPAGALAALLGTLEADTSALIVLTNVERGAPWRANLQKDLGHVSLLDRPQVLPYLDLRGLDWAGFLASRSANFRSQLGRKSRALERLHTVRCRQTETAADLAVDLRKFFSLHDDRWASRGGSSSSSRNMRTFLSRVCSRALEQGWLRLWTLELDGTAAAIWLGWRVGDRYAYYLAGFDPARGHQSPGLILLAGTVEAAFAEGAAEYDFLLGDEAYKARFASAVREVETEILGSRWSPRLLVGRVDRKLRRAGRRLPAPARTLALRAARVLHGHLPLSRHR